MLILASMHQKRKQLWFWRSNKNSSRTWNCRINAIRIHEFSKEIYEWNLFQYIKAKSYLPLRWTNPDFRAEFLGCIPIPIFSSSPGVCPGSSNPVKQPFNPKIGMPIVFNRSNSCLFVCLFVCTLNSWNAIDGVAELPDTQTALQTDVRGTYCS